ncbi:MAG: chemotaxis protein CheX [Tissierellia bacterium]|nr:chemotaxis protein CheX [Tissierellia bacterium]
MKVDHINAFYVAIQEIFKLMLDLDVEKGELRIVEDMVSSKDANVLLGITGDLKGSILFGFPKHMALEMVNIMSGVDMDEIDTFVSSALGEVVNIIGGNALTSLSNYDYICNMAPPQIIVGKYKSISMASERSLLIPLETEIGKFDVNVFLAEAKNIN